MKSYTLDFELLYGLSFFNITFDTERPGKNLLMSVTMDEWPLDDIELKTTHKDLYKMIVAKMGEVSMNYWREVKTDQQKRFDKMPDYTQLCDDLNKICIKMSDALIEELNK